MNKKQIIRINENQLKQIVTESVKRVLKEGEINEYGQPIGDIKHIEKDYNSKDYILNSLYGKIDVLEGLLRYDYAKLTYLNEIRHLVKRLASFINKQEK